MSWLSFLHYDSPQAIRYKEEWLSYQDLYRKTCARIDYLKEQGVCEGDRVAFLSENCLDHLLLLFACARLGAIFVPLNFRAPEDENKKTIELISPKLFLEELPPLTMKYDYDFHAINEDHTPLMLFTSGSTGKSKGVLLSGKMLESNQKHTCQGWGLLSNDTSIVETPFFHTGAYNVLCLPLLSIGGKIVLAEKFLVDNFYDLKDELTVYFGVPTMFELLAKDPRFETLKESAFRFLISGGAPCPENLIEKFQQLDLQFKQGYGLTEAGPNCFLLEEQYAVTKLGSIGKPMTHSQVLLLDEETQSITRPHHVGEIVIKGDHLCSGFYQRQDDFQNSLQDGYYKTGDLAFFDEDGFYFIKGRKKEMYISGGENVYPREVEEVINSFKEVENAQIVAVPDETWGEVGYAFLTLSEDVSKHQIEERLKKSLARYKHPKHMTIVQNFPLLANGKIDKLALKKEAMRRTHAH